MADVIFLKKDGKKDYSKTGSYRPISITSYIGKVFEQIIAARLEKFFKSTGHKDQFQEGFTKRRNTVRYLNRLDNDIRDKLSKKYNVICLFIDFEKAFDSVWKKGLMKKLHDVGIKGSVWTLLNSFLFNRKVRLIFNDYTGFVRTCREFGLPQGSALSPILFKFFLSDLAEEVAYEDDIAIFKFADDGTLRVLGITTELCLKNLEIVCDAIYKWSITWRMIINCEPSKTELLCFGTAENDATLIPASFDLGRNRIAFVDKTKVLGLTMDNKLSYVEHGKDINKKILGRWVMICKYTNRNWGFRQHVIVRLVEVLIATCIQYAGIIWINNRSIKEVEHVWYKMLKSALGAVFNVKLATSEAILGVPPIAISNRVNSIKHVLKLNIFDQSDGDPLKDFIISHLKSNNYSPLTGKVKETYQFLVWKSKRQPESFTTQDLQIINNMDLERFSELTPKSCMYSKGLIKMFTVSIWQTTIDSQYQAEGFTDAPKVSATKLRFPMNTTREFETLLLSLFYPNNLMNEFLYRYDSTKFVSPTCCCGYGEQNSKHVLLHCYYIEFANRAAMNELLFNNPIHPYYKYGGNAFLISWSRIPEFFNLCCKIIEDGIEFLRLEVNLYTITPNVSRIINIDRTKIL